MGTYGFVYRQSDSARDGIGTLYTEDSSTNTAHTYKFTSLSIQNLRSSSSTFTYEITFDGLTVASGSLTVAGGKTGTKTLNASKTLAKTHESRQITLAITGSGPRYQCSNSYSVAHPAKTHYSVTYNANGGTSGPASQTKWHGEALTLTSNVPSRAGYAFWHWNTASDNSGTTYAPGASYAANAALALYAIWNPIITYDANGGDGGPTTQTKTYGVNLAISTLRPTRSGYVFAGWGTTPTTGTVSYASGATYSSNAPAALYAVWNPIVTYNANGGTGAPASQTKVRGQALTLSSTTPTRSGYAFGGWNTAADGSGTSYSAGGTVAASNNTPMTLYAKWRREPSPPQITAISAVRCDSTGAADDAGDHCRVEVAWSVDATSDTVSNNYGTVTGTYRAQGSGTDTPITWSSGAGGQGVTSGTAVAILANIDIDLQYTVTVTVTDRKPQSSSRTDICTRAKFLLDFRAGGDAIGIGMAAPEHGLGIGMETTHTERVTLVDKPVHIRTSAIDRDGQPAGSLVEPGSARLYLDDRDGEPLGIVYSQEGQTGAIQLVLMAVAESPGGTRYSNYLIAGVDRSGNRTYGVPYPAEFLAALHGGVLTYSQADVVEPTATNVSAVTSFTFRRWGNLRMIYMAFTFAAQVPASTLFEVGYIKSGHRPAVVIGVDAHGFTRRALVQADGRICYYAESGAAAGSGGSISGVWFCPS